MGRRATKSAGQRKGNTPTGPHFAGENGLLALSSSPARTRWWAHQDSNLEPKDYESSALTIELWARAFFIIAADRAIEKKSPAMRGFSSFVQRADYSRSRKLRSCSERVGWRSLRSAFASIWRIRSRVTSNCLPTSSSV